MKVEIETKSEFKDGLRNEIEFKTFVVAKDCLEFKFCGFGKASTQKESEKIAIADFLKLLTLGKPTKRLAELDIDKGTITEI